MEEIIIKIKKKYPIENVVLTHEKEIWKEAQKERDSHWIRKLSKIKSKLSEGEELKLLLKLIEKITTK